MLTLFVSSTEFSYFIYSIRNTLGKNVELSWNWNQSGLGQSLANIYQN